MPHDTALDDHENFIGNEKMAELRLRCLEIAVQANDPDSPIGTADLMGVAQTLLHYVLTGDYPRMVSFEDIDPRADLHLGDPSLHIPRGSDTVSTVEAREHAPQEDDPIDERVDGGTAAGA